MSGNVRVRALAVIAVVVLASALIGGCKAKSSESKATPSVVPPAVKQAGVLRVGIDLSAPPFGGVDLGKQAGIDVDVAKALADKLGLELVVVDVKASDVATALADGRVDAVLSVPFSQAAVSRVSIAGTYLSDGPGLFTSSDSSISVSTSRTVDTLPSSLRLGAQKGSAAYWQLVSEVGSESVSAYSSLREALVALSERKIDAVGGDVLIGAYIARDLNEIRFAGQITSAHLLGVGVDSKNTTLADAVRKALDRLAGEDVFNIIRRKWTGNLPVLTLPEGAETSASVAASAAK